MAWRQIPPFPTRFRSSKSFSTGLKSAPGIGKSSSCNLKIFLKKWGRLKDQTAGSSSLSRSIDLMPRKIWSKNVSKVSPKRLSKTRCTDWWPQITPRRNSSIPVSTDRPSLFAPNCEKLQRWFIRLFTKIQRKNDGIRWKFVPEF